MVATKRRATIFLAISLLACANQLNAQQSKVQFDSTALATTFTTLNSAATLDSVDTPVREILGSLGQKYNLQFDTQSVQNAINTYVTHDAKGTIGESLVDLLGQIHCTYTIRPDGVIAIAQQTTTRSTRSTRSSRALSSRQRISTMEQYIEELIKQYDKDKDGKLSASEMEKVRSQPPQSADSNQDGLWDAKELLQYYDRGNSRSSGR